MRCVGAMPLLAALLLASPAQAEVSDKMLMVDHRVDPWIWPAILCAFALALELKWPRFGLATLPFSAFLAFGIYSQFNDPYVGPAILHELGDAYVRNSWIAIGFALLFPIALTIGLSNRRERLRAQVNPGAPE